MKTEYFFAWFDGPVKERDDDRCVVYHVKVYDGNLFCGADKRTDTLLHQADEPLSVPALQASINTGSTCVTCIKILKKKLESKPLNS